MIPVEPVSQSIILRATHILEIRLNTVNPDEWSHHPSGWLERRVKIEGILINIFKGAVWEAENDTIRLTVIQLGSESPWETAVPGVWSERVLKPESHLVAFCSGQSETAAELLREPLCQQLQPASDAADDVALALQIETEHLGLEQVVDQAIQTAPTLNDVFVEYLWARWENMALHQEDYIEQILRLLLAPSLNYIARATLLTLILNDLLSSQGTKAVMIQFAVALFDLLQIPQAQPMHDNIIDTYLPSLLGLNTSTELPAREVFANAPDQHQAAINLFDSQQGKADALQLFNWLQSHRR